MMFRRATWALIFVGLTVVLAVTIGLAQGFYPRIEDLKDPLGRPTDLANSVIFSASEFDRLTGIILPDQVELRKKITVLIGVANDLDVLVDTAGQLDDLAVEINDDTGGVIGVARQLPPLIARVTGRANQGANSVTNLNAAVEGANTQFQAVGDQIRAILPNLQALEGRASNIAAVLAQLEQEAAAVGPLAPALGLLNDLLGPIVNVVG
ncbi:MAG: hypothetical protein ACT4PW_00375 [Acidimicrobiia bacterium]